VNKVDDQILRRLLLGIVAITAVFVLFRAVISA
jgi:hypothetical protein